MKYLKKFLVLLIFPFLAGCLWVAAGAGGGVGYTLANIAHETYSHPLGKVNQAMVKTLKKMDITIIDNSKTAEGRKIKCSTRSLDIYITLEKVTAKVTKAVINAKAGWITKDKDTANEILRGTRKRLG